MKYLRVVKLEQFQHYKNRGPYWIKLHNSLLSSRSWVKLDDASRVLMIACMLIASKTNNQIPLDAEYVRRVAYLHEEPNFQPLIDVGFLETCEGESRPPLGKAKTHYLTAENAGYDDGGTTNDR